MPHGFFTIEQWTASQDSAKAQWIPNSSPGFLSILDEGDDDAGEAWPSWPLSNRADAAMYLGANGRWKVGRLHARAASSPENSPVVEIYEREGGRRPVEKARQQRAQVKADRAKR